jgi:hypothetical protein
LRVKNIIPTIKRTTYKAFGLHVRSEIELPALIEQDEKIDNVDIEIVIEDLSNYWDGLDGKQKNYAFEDHQFLFEIPDTAIYCIREGNKIIVSPMAGSDEDLVRLYLLGSCMGAILMQRRILPLHGSSVVINGKAYAFVGESGAGKSTLAATLLNQGFSLLSDDVIALSFTDEGTPIVTPSYPQQKLWQNSIERLGMQTNDYVPLYQEINKYAIPVSNRFHSGSFPLAGVFELVITEDEVSIVPIKKLERFPVLFRHTYRNFLVPFLKLEQWHFNMSAKIINQIDVYQIRRSNHTFSAHQLTTQILNMVNKGV